MRNFKEDLTFFRLMYTLKSLLHEQFIYNRVNFHYPQIFMHPIEN